MRKYCFTLILGLLLCAAPSMAQQFNVIAGRVCEIAGNRPVHYASVTLEGSSVSNVTNRDGLFSLKIPADTGQNAFITISLLGYARISLPVSEFNGTTPDNPLEIKIVPISLKLDAATIHALDAGELVKSALAAVPSNYLLKPEGMTAFYREMICKGRNRYLALNEAVLDVEKASYTGFHSDKVGIYKGRGSVNYDSSDTLMIHFQGGVNAILEVDQVKNRFLGVEPSELNLFYDFSMGESQMMDRRLFHVVEFNQKPSSIERGDFLYRGRLYIDSETMAIGRIECNMNVEKRPEATSIFILKRPPGARIEISSAYFSVNYKMIGSIWYYDHANQELKFEARKKYWPFKNSYSIRSEIVITNHKKGEFKVAPQSRLRFRDQLSGKIASFTDADFWDDYNVIEPDQSIDVIIKKIIRQLKKHNDENQAGR